MVRCHYVQCPGICRDMWSFNFAKIYIIRDNNQKAISPLEEKKLQYSNHDSDQMFYRFFSICATDNTIDYMRKLEEFNIKENLVCVVNLEMEPIFSPCWLPRLTPDSLQI